MHTTRFSQNGVSLFGKWLINREREKSAYPCVSPYLLLQPVQLHWLDKSLDAIRDVIWCQFISTLYIFHRRRRRLTIQSFGHLFIRFFLRASSSSFIFHSVVNILSQTVRSHTYNITYTYICIYICIWQYKHYSFIQFFKY